MIADLKGVIGISPMSSGSSGALRFRDEELRITCAAEPPLSTEEGALRFLVPLGGRPTLPRRFLGSLAGVSADAALTAVVVAFFATVLDGVTLLADPGVAGGLEVDFFFGDTEASAAAVSGAGDFIFDGVFAFEGVFAFDGVFFFDGVSSDFEALSVLASGGTTNLGNGQRGTGQQTDRLEVQT